MVITKENAVIGWTLGKFVTARRVTMQHRPCCTIELSEKAKSICPKATAKLGLWGI